MPEPQDPAELLVQHLGRINRIAGSLCRRHGLSHDESEDFASWAVTKLMENDYAAVRKFRGESSFPTFLTVVVSMLYRDFRVSELGRWRPSAAARRHGDIAVRLETLVRRDGYDVSQAAEVLRSAGKTDLSDGELRALIAKLPSDPRGRPRRTGEEPLATVASLEAADGALNDAEAEAERRALRDALGRALGSLSDEDRVILQLRFWEELTVADIARTLHLDQKPLYRRLDRLYSLLRQDLEKSGVSATRVRTLLDEERE